LPEVKCNDITTLADANDCWVNDDNMDIYSDAQFYQGDDTGIPVSPYTKCKQRLAEKWNALRNDA